MMTLILGEKTLQGALNMVEAIDLVEDAYKHEVAGQTVSAPRQMTITENGWTRLMITADYENTAQVELNVRRNVLPLPCICSFSTLFNMRIINPILMDISEEMMELAAMMEKVELSGNAPNGKILPTIGEKTFTLDILQGQNWAVYYMVNLTLNR